MVEALDVDRYLKEAFLEDYKAKFDRVIQPNEFSVSTLVDGPGTALKYRAANYDLGLKQKFNLYFFRGSAIHEKVNERLAQKKDSPGPIHDEWLFHQELSMDFDGIKVYGHPDAINSVNPIILEFKTLDSESIPYRQRVVKKATRQVGCYAKMLEEYNDEVYEAFIVVFDFLKKSPITDKQMEEGWGLKNGLFEYQLTEMDLEYGQILNDQMFVLKLQPDEISHSYNYVRWCAREAWSRMNDPDSLFGAGVC